MKKDRRIETIERLQDDEHVFWEGWLKSGWCWGDQGLHVLHEDTRKEVLESAWLIQVCTCEECQRRSV